MTIAGPRQDQVALQSEFTSHRSKAQILASDGVVLGGKQRAPDILSSSYTIQTMGCYSKLCEGQLGTNMVEQLPRNNLDATSSAWEFQLPGSDLAVTSGADKRGR